MALPNFPDNPVVGQSFSVGDVLYKCTSISPRAVWTTVASSGVLTRTIRDYGGVGDGLTNDYKALLDHLTQDKHAVIPPDFRLFLGQQLVMPVGTTIEFRGGIGNTQGALPSSRIIKSATINGPAVIMQENCQWIGGGIIGQDGNSGGGITVWGNGVFIDRAMIIKCGGDGIRIGKDSAYQNCNSFYLNKVITCLNTGHGIAIHDGFSEATASADANAGTITHAFSYQNGGHGIYCGRTWWTTIINALTEGNAGYGLYVDHTVVAPDTVARCRYLNIFGGDFNEGNTQGSLWFKGYACNYFHASANQAIVKGGVLNNIYGGGGENINWGQEINRFLNINANQGEDEQAKYPVQIKKIISGSAGDSVGIAIRANTTNYVEPHVISATFEAEFKEPNEWMGVIRVRDGNGDADAGQLVRALVVDPRFKRWYPGADNQWTLGDRVVRFKGIYSILPEYLNDGLAASNGEPIGTFYTVPGENIVRVRKV